MDSTTFDIDKFIGVFRYTEHDPMLFNTGLFLILFAFFVGLYHLLSRHRTSRMVVVILFSLFFYYKSAAGYCFILLGVCVSDYLLGRILGLTDRRWQRRLIVTINVVLNVGMLLYFKYFNLLIDTINNFTVRDFDALDIIAPAGISFFVFRSISYIVDIYRRTIEPATNFLDYCFFLTFFPPLLAGPVVRAKDLLPQIKANNPATRAMVSEGLFLIIAGLIKKVVVADYIGDNFVNRVFDNPALYSGFENMLGLYGFTLQLYCDFSGYSDMAIGLALLLGFRFADNFRSPFKSQSPTEFWRRWHISLSSWLRDYVYIPMGGNRCSKTRRNFNLFSTMVIGGLWHGASWMYVIWGALHGFFLIAHKTIVALFPRISKSHHDTPWWRVAINIFVTFNLVAIAFMFFRADSLEKVTDMTRQIFTSFHWAVIPEFINRYLLVVLAILFGFFLHFTPAGWQRSLKARWDSSPLILQAVLLALVLFLIIQVRQSDIVPFIYLQY